jgi:hypothetical protein
LSWEKGSNSGGDLQETMETVDRIDIRNYAESTVEPIKLIRAVFKEGV